MWHHSGAEVVTLETNPARALDLSAVTGKQRAVVLLKVRCHSAIGGTFRAGVTTGTRSSELAVFTLARPYALIAAATDITGEVAWIEGTGIFTVIVLGYAPANIPAPPESMFGPGAAGSWKEIDTSTIEAGTALGIFEWAHSAGAAVDGKMRVSGDADEMGAGANVCAVTAALPTARAVDVTSPLGELFDPGANEVEVACIALVDGTRGFNLAGALVWAAANPPAAWTDLDLSAVVGAQRCLVVLKVTCTENQPDDQYVSFRPNGDIGTYQPAAADGLGVGSCFVEFLLSSYVLVETDASGIVEWMGTVTRDVRVDVLGWVDNGDPITSPTVTHFEPSGVTTTLPRIAARVEDDYGLDTSTIAFSMGDESIITAGSFTTGWGGSVVALQVGDNGPREVLVTVTSWPELPNGALVEFDLSIENIYGDTP